MAPKVKKANAKAGGGAAPDAEAAVAEEAAPAPPSVASGVAPVAAATATDLISEAVSNAWKTIQACGVFKDIDKAAPLGIDTAHGKLSGFKASYVETT
jgi:hypothetical protein